MRLLAIAWSLCSCSFSASPSYPRPEVALAWPSFAAAVAAPELESFDELGEGRATGVLVGGGETVRFHLRRGSAVAGPQPLVLVVPILAGGDDLMDQVAQRMTARGFDVAFCARAGSALRPPQRAPELDELFRRTVLHQRLLLAWLRHSAPTPPTALFALGMSMGGMVTTVLAALEPDLTGIAICLSGGDLAGLVPHSSEGRVQAWVDWRFRTDGVGFDHLGWELRQFLRHEPLAFAASVPTAKVLFVGAEFDTVVPRRNQDLLWEGLGRPARLQVPLGHYSAALAMDPILSAAAAHFVTLGAKAAH
ncbi:MAG: hypothetical protein ABIP94_16330 [Planctomycetota bacterium]